MLQRGSYYEEQKQTLNAIYIAAGCV